MKPGRTRPPGCGRRELSRRYAFGPFSAAAGVCIAAAFLCWSCGGGEGGGRGAPERLREIAPEEYEKLVHVGDVPSRDYEETGDVLDDGAGEAEEPREEYRRGGTLRGKGDADSFEVNAKYDQVDVVFVWPEGQTDFWVKVYGEKGDELGDFDLDEGEIIQLLNGGKFTVEVYSKGGGGSWSAAYQN